MAEGEGRGGIGVVSRGAGGKEYWEVEREMGAGGGSGFV